MVEADKMDAGPWHGEGGGRKATRFFIITDVSIHIVILLSAIDFIMRSTYNDAMICDVVPHNIHTVHALEKITAGETYHSQRIGKTYP